MASEPLPPSALNSATTRVLIKARESLLDRLLPAQEEDADFQEQVDFRRKGRLLVASSFLLASAALLFGTLTFLLDDNWPVTVSLLAVGFCIVVANLVAFQRGYGLQRAAWILVVATVMIMTGICLDSLGLYNSAMWWLLVVPPLTVVLLGGRAAVWSTGMVAIGITTVFLFQDQIPGEINHEEDMFPWLSSTLVAVFMGILVLMSENQRLSAQRQLASTLETMRDLNEELSSSNAAQLLTHEIALRDAEAKARFLVRMKRETERQHTALDSTGDSMRVVESTAATLTESADTLSKSALHSSTVVEEMTRYNDSMLENVQDLVATASAAMTEIEAMTRSTHEVSDAIAGLTVAAEEASMSMSQMQSSTAHIQENANTTASLAEAVIRDAELGVAKVGHTAKGIEAIRATSTEVFQTIRRLEEKSNAITDVLVVIDDVTHQTNLLALNAAILAAQAGEDGKGFAVVADEIKKLAERTRASTSTIAELIFAVRNEAKDAVSAILRGEAAVENGVRLSEESQKAFSTIVDSARRSTEMARAIAGASAEQLNGARIVSGTAQQVAATVSDVADMSRRQTEGSDNIVRAASRMRSVAEHVERSTLESARAGRELLDVTMKLSQMSLRLNDAQRRQQEGTREVLGAIDQIRDAQERQTRSLEALAGEGDDDATDSGLRKHPGFHAINQE